MPQSLKQIKNRIKSIENTKKVTNAMQIISVAKLSNIENGLLSLRAYFARLDGILNRFLSDTGSDPGTFLKKRQGDRFIGLCVVTSDSGLCGMYNQNVIRLAENFISEKGRGKIRLILVGRKGFNYFKKRRAAVLNTYIGLNGRYSEKAGNEILNNLINIFVTGEVDEVYVAYTAYKTGLIHRPALKKFLNIEPAGVPQRKIEYIIEPHKERILEELLPRYISMKIRLILLEAFASEHASRALAMKTATENAEELLEGLTLLRNKVRQAQITQEIMEIISASEALK